MSSRPGSKVVPAPETRSPLPDHTWPDLTASDEEFSRQVQSASWHVFASCTPLFLQRMAPVMQRVSDISVELWDVVVKALTTILGEDFTVQVAETAFDQPPGPRVTTFDPRDEFKSALHLWDSRNVEVEALSAPGVLLPDQRLAPTNRLELDTAGKTRWQGRPLAVPPATSQH